MPRIFMTLAFPRCPRRRPPCLWPRDVYERANSTQPKPLLRPHMVFSPSQPVPTSRNQRPPPPPQPGPPLFILRRCAACTAAAPPCVRSRILGAMIVSGSLFCFSLDAPPGSPCRVMLDRREDEIFCCVFSEVASNPNPAATRRRFFGAGVPVGAILRHHSNTNAVADLLPSPLLFSFQSSIPLAPWLFAPGSSLHPRRLPCSSRSLPGMNRRMLESASIGVEDSLFSHSDDSA